MSPLQSLYKLCSFLHKYELTTVLWQLQPQAESTGYNALPLPPRLMQADTHSLKDTEQHNTFSAR